MDFGIAEIGIACGSPPWTTTEVLRFGIPIAEIRVVSVAGLSHDCSKSLFFEAVVVDTVCLVGLSLLVELDSWSSKGNVGR
jgi:hypothetical protein